MANSKQQSKKSAKSELSDGRATLVVAILGLLFFLPFFSLLSIPAFIDSLEQKRRAAAAGTEPSGNIQAAFVLSIVGLVLLVVVAIVAIVFFVWAAGEMQEHIHHVPRSAPIPDDFAPVDPKDIPQPPVPGSGQDLRPVY